MERGSSEDLLVRAALLGEGHLPHPCKTLIKPNLFPHLEALVLAQRPAFNQAVYAPVRKAVSVTFVVEPAAGQRTSVSRKRMHGLLLDVYQVLQIEIHLVCVVVRVKEDLHE